MAQQGRFEVIYTEGADQNYAGTIQILVDRETGVNYLVFNTGNGAGITPLLSPTGKIILS